MLKCLNCDEEYYDEYQLNCTSDGCEALLRTTYRNKTLELEDHTGLFKFINWLPVEKPMNTKAGPITYHATQLGEKLDLTNLFVSFNGYWPEKGAFVESCSFKEYEAYPTLQRMRERKQGILQVSSAGNTARAFAIASSHVGAKVVLVVPIHALDRVWTINGEHEDILLLTVDGDYFDAITFGKALVNKFDNLLPEGGARNVARRDGMGLTMLDAAIKIGTLPNYYFQGVGSGTGGIAAYEMSLKLLEDGRFGDEIPQFYLSQNEPFTPMVNAWKNGRKQIIDDIDMPNARESIDKIYAKLLSNRVPPYSVKGGVFDVLSNSGGNMLGVTNKEAHDAFDLFQEVEGIDIDPSAAVALASLIKAKEDEMIERDAKIMLNISGGGYERIMKENEICYVQPSMKIKETDYSIISEKVEDLVMKFISD